MITFKNGNLLYVKEKMVCQQVNTKGVMGNSRKCNSNNLAHQIRNVYGNDVYLPYSKLCKTKGNLLLGTVQVLHMTDGKLICNMFAQEDFGYTGRYTDYDSFKKCCQAILDYCRENNITSVAMPDRIGCNRGGAFWPTIRGILEDYFSDDINLTIYIYNSKER